LPKNAKESVDLPDFVKESVAQIQILCTFQARAAKGRRAWRETRALAAHGAPYEATRQGSAAHRK